MTKLITVVETAEFQRFASRHLSAGEREALITHVATHPADGVLIRESGGLRKLRWAARGKGKSGGVRVIYFHHDADMPVLLITGFAKSEMGTLSKAMRNTYRQMLPEIVRAYKEKKR